MNLGDYIVVAMKVLGDWRVIAATLVIILSWGLFRFVGIIFNRKPLRMIRGVRPPKGGAKKTAGPAEPAEK
jgi:hypothetical protein